MKKTVELLKDISDKRNEIEKLYSENKVDEAFNLSKDLETIMKEYKVAAAVEESNQQNFSADKFSLADKPAANYTESQLANRAFNKLVFGKFGKPTDEEMKAYYNVTNESGKAGKPGQIESIAARGGYLVPEEQMNELYEFRKAYVELKPYTTYRTVNSVTGKFPILPYQQLEFQSFDELTDIAESDMTFAQATYTIEDKGLILPISNQLIQDANQNIMDICGRQLAQGAVYSENKAILEPLNTLIASTDTATATGITALNQAMYKTLDATYYPNTKIFTNQDGFLFLSNLQDSTNRPLFVPDVTAPDKYIYRGKEIVVLPNRELANITSGSNEFAPFFIGDLSSYIYFFERLGLEMAVSTELYFRKYGTALRAVKRFGTTVVDKDAIVALKMKL